MPKKDFVEDLFTHKLTIGVTGFSRAGKTVFIGALTQALLTADAWKTKRGQGPLAQFGPFERDAFMRARIRYDINSHLPQFPFIKVRDSLISTDARWPEPTDGISRLVLDLDYKLDNWLKSVRHIRLELVDYPGEWLSDLPMLGQTYIDWSGVLLAQAKNGPRSEWSNPYLQMLDRLTDTSTFNEETVEALSDCWADYLQTAVRHGFTCNQPGRLLRPGLMRNSPLLRLVPLPEELQGTGMWEGMEKRFREYQGKVIKPFYRDHFKNMDRQIVLIDVLRTLELGMQAFDELIESLRGTLASFNYGRNGPLSWLLGGRTSHVLFAATKADHVVRGDRANLEQMILKMLALVDENNDLKGRAKQYDAIAIASIRATEDRMTISAPKREVLYGKPKGQASCDQRDPGGLPLDMPPNWDEVQFEFYKYEPLPMPAARYEGFPAINLGKALDFLIGDTFK